MRSIDDIKNDIRDIENKMIEGCYRVDSGIDTIDLRYQRSRLEDELTLVCSKLVASNAEMDIYEQRKYKDHYVYYVTLHDTYSIIGYVTTDYGNGPHPIGNVGYEIYSKYRGHGYTKKALELLLDVFIDRGMEISVIVINPDNIASVKTTENFGGILVRKAASEHGVNIYNVDLKQKLLSRQKVKF